MYTGETRINYYDLDFNGNIKLSALLRMVHIAAEVNANQLNIGFETLHPLHISFVIQRFGVKVTRMPKYNETVTIRTWPADTSRGTFTRKGDMYDQEGNKLMEWASLWILFDTKNRKILKPSALPLPIPALDDIPVDITPQKVVIPSEATVLSDHTHTVRYADVDTNMHMNNSIYGDLIGNAAFATDISQDKNIAEIQINFTGETTFGDQIKITASTCGDTVFVYGATYEKSSLAASIVFK